MGDVWKGETNDGALWRKVKEMEVKEKERERGREGGREKSWGKVEEYKVIGLDRKQGNAQRFW